MRASRVACILLALALAVAACRRGGSGAWSSAERAQVASLCIDALGPPPEAPSNRVADHPGAAWLGRELFHDKGLSRTGAVACATCHRPEMKYTDGLPVSVGAGLTTRNAPSIAGAAWSPWMFWDGRRDSQWAQALGPLEAAAEQGFTRVEVVRHVATQWREPFEALFGPLPTPGDIARLPERGSPLGSEDEVTAWQRMSDRDRHVVNAAFANAGKAIAAFERRLVPGPARFDRWARALKEGREPAPEDALDADEIAGLRLFIGEARCISCHSGPLLMSGEFHNTAMSPAAAVRPPEGRARGVVSMLEDPFNCLGRYSDAEPEACEELRFVKVSGDELAGAMKVPGLRNVADTAPYLQDGSQPGLASLLARYREAPQPLVGHSDLVPLDLSDDDLRRIEAFLRTLSSDINEPSDLAPPATLSAEGGVTASGGKS